MSHMTAQTVAHGIVLGLGVSTSHATKAWVYLINPRRACAARVTVLALSVCVCVCVCSTTTPHLYALNQVRTGLL